MSNNAIKNDRVYTYADYLNWPENERWEIIDGVAYAMAPPSTTHQRIIGNLFVEFATFLKGKPCEAFIAPFGVTFDKTAKDETNPHAVEPDITVICDKSKITAQGCKGAPDLIIEVLSRSTASHDVIKKRRLYEQNGVLEYWIVDPSNQIITRFHLNEELFKYREPEYFARDNTIIPISFPALEIKLEDIFPDTTEE
ncbi:Uma2 family endonuclease [Sporomusa acidovorans]|uniref:Putative restriction endonuclease domain-containing protein n=1 Tax=Sporomusa acidovorans (strain ATCC 49682 / DSM 3132 / Mol) TaxID=1123286 RepID=A0ABZ3IXR8_SPOA4|nr:Uma2 family endonuclease [Sporomusa acidovorans]OZC22194.1 hypothetical protein SPACI_15450 [Sporomusa acidovorans DSM 3132]SDE81807.1 Endonuclease, Uma2 family (restriction endonuclease fold) [Sporomusa acidovorans]